MLAFVVHGDILVGVVRGRSLRHAERRVHAVPHTTRTRTRTRTPLISLNPGVPRLTFSMEFDMDPATGKVVARRACKSVIESCAKLTYGVAQTMLDGKFDPEAQGVPVLHGGHTWPQVCCSALLVQHDGGV